MDKIPTAEDFAHEHRLSCTAWIAREYAKLHVTAALKAAAEELVKQLREKPTEIVWVKSTILTAYSEENIK